jgi:hypothetical protein
MRPIRLEATLRGSGLLASAGAAALTGCAVSTAPYYGYPYPYAPPPRPPVVVYQSPPPSRWYYNGRYWYHRRWNGTRWIYY